MRPGSVISRDALRPSRLSCWYGQGALAPYQPSLFSVPDDTSHAPMARDIVSEKARSFLDGIERMLRPADESHALDPLDWPITSYVDPVLASSRRHYVGFVKRMHKCGLAVLCWEPLEFVG